MLKLKGWSQAFGTTVSDLHAEGAVATLPKTPRFAFRAWLSSTSLYHQRCGNGVILILRTLPSWSRYAIKTAVGSHIAAQTILYLHLGLSSMSFIRWKYLAIQILMPEFLAMYRLSFSRATPVSLSLGFMDNHQSIFICFLGEGFWFGNYQMLNKCHACLLVNLQVDYF